MMQIFDVIFQFELARSHSCFLLEKYVIKNCFEEFATHILYSSVEDNGNDDIEYMETGILDSEN